MKGPAPVEMPSFFTVEWYKTQKNSFKKTDKEIANELFISVWMLFKWKKQIGWEPHQIYKLMNGRKPKLNQDEIKRLKDEGLSTKDIANHFDVTIQAVHYWLKNKIAQ